MSHYKQVQKNNYFQYRKIDSSSYTDFKLPFWIKNEACNYKAKILDYGCGLGQVLQSLKTEGNTYVYGIDIEKTAIKYCRSQGLNVKELDTVSLKNPFEFKFDIIILSHVLEHIPKNEAIKTLIVLRKSFLAPEGKLLIAVPNAQSNTGSYWAYEDWTHTTLFTSGSLYYILKAAGFQTIDFIDIDCVMGTSKCKKIIIKFFLEIYKKNKIFWNKVTCSSYHKPSPEIFSYEIKVKAY